MGFVEVENCYLLALSRPRCGVHGFLLTFDWLIYMYASANEGEV